jgi:hypothetical protein
MSEQVSDFQETWCERHAIDSHTKLAMILTYGPEILHGVILGNYLTFVKNIIAQHKLPYNGGRAKFIFTSRFVMPTLKLGKVADYKQTYKFRVKHFFLVENYKHSTFLTTSR